MYLEILQNFRNLDYANGTANLFSLEIHHVQVIPCRAVREISSEKKKNHLIRTVPLPP